ncbi:MAG: Fic family protein [Microlunatus sp.]
MARRIGIADLAGVVYSSGKVFNGLSTGRLDTENFLRSGSLSGIASRSDLALLEDLRDVASLIIEHADRPVNAAFVRQINAQITRTGALHPGQFRTSEQQIGVNTRYGRHTPDAVTDDALQHLIEQATASPDREENALDLFIEIAKAQPFEDGNKRTALFAANCLLLGADTGTLLVVPVDEHDPTLSEQFNDLLARAYLEDDHAGVKALLRTRGLVDIDSRKE